MHFIIVKNSIALDRKVETYVLTFRKKYGTDRQTDTRSNSTRMRLIAASPCLCQKKSGDFCHFRFSG